MRFEIYVAVGGEHFDATAFLSKANAPGARTKEIGHLGAKIRPDLIKRWVIWESERVVGSSNPGDDVKNLLRQHRGLLPLLANEDRTKIECWVEIVAYFDEGEVPRGFSFDAATIALLSEFGASLDIDAVYDLKKPGPM